MSTANRSLKPYPPAGLAIVDTSEAGGNVAVTWLNRNRLSPTIVKQTAATQAMEVGQTITLRIYANDGTTLLRTVTALTGTSYNYDDLDEIADAGAFQLHLTFKIRSVRAGYESVDAVIVLDRTDSVIDGANFVKDGSNRVIV